MTREDYGVDLTGEDFYFIAGAGYEPRIVKTKRIGVDYAGHWKDRLLRFIDASSPLAGKLKM